MSGLLRRRRVFAAKVEATVGTAESLTGAEAAFNAEDFVIQPNIAMTRRQGQGGDGPGPGLGRPMNVPESKSAWAVERLDRRYTAAGLWI